MIVFWEIVIRSYLQLFTIVLIYKLFFICYSFFCAMRTQPLHDYVLKIVIWSYVQSFTTVLFISYSSFCIPFLCHAAKERAITSARSWHPFSVPPRDWKLRWTKSLRLVKEIGEEVEDERLLVGAHNFVMFNLYEQENI